MPSILTFGFYGKEWGSMSGSRTYKQPQEPILSVDFVLHELRILNKGLRIEVDMGLVWQGKTKADNQHIRKIWIGIRSRELSWPELKTQFEQLLELGGGLLPLMFKMRCGDFLLEVVDGEHTLLVIGRDLAALKKLKRKVERESRVSPYGKVGNPPTLLTK